MHFSDYQDGTGRTAIYPKDRALEYLALGLASEAGEVAGIIKKHIRDGGEISVAKVIDEIGDVLWYISELCNTLKVDMGVVSMQNLEKLQDRANRGVLSGSGDNR